MSIEPQALSEHERRAVLWVCILAAFADGAQNDAERSRIREIVEGSSGERLDRTSAYQDVLEGKLTLAQATDQLQTPASRALAYEMGVCVCQADDILNASESQFLTDLRRALQLDASSTVAHRQQAEALVTESLTAPIPPVIQENREQELDQIILNASILNGALEIVPQSISTMAIIPLQMRLVYRIGKHYGFDLDRGHIKEFLAILGVGITSQVFEGYARKLVGGLARGIAGRFLGGLAAQATGSAFGFATTYALGQVARNYYAGGRSLSAAQLKETFASMLQNARSLENRYSGQIMEKSRQVNVAELLPLIKQQ
jgi:uncharacterized protein (DUF697 family)/tellurite resistance protein